MQVGTVIGGNARASPFIILIRPAWAPRSCANPPARFPGFAKLSVKARRSGAYSVKRSASRAITPSQVNQNSGHPCSNNSGWPCPVRATWNAAPLAETLKCSILWLLFASPGALGNLDSVPCLARHPRLELAPTAGEESPAMAPGEVAECRSDPPRNEA